MRADSCASGNAWHGVGCVTWGRSTKPGNIREPTQRATNNASRRWPQQTARCQRSQTTPQHNSHRRSTHAVNYSHLHLHLPWHDLDCAVQGGAEDEQTPAGMKQAWQHLATSSPGGERSLLMAWRGPPRHHCLIQQVRSRCCVSAICRLACRWFK